MTTKSPPDFTDTPPNLIATGHAIAGMFVSATPEDLCRLVIGEYERSTGDVTFEDAEHTCHIQDRQRRAYFLELIGNFGRRLSWKSPDGAVGARPVLVATEYPEDALVSEPPELGDHRAIHLTWGSEALFLQSLGKIASLSLIDPIDFDDSIRKAALSDEGELF